MWIIKRNVYIVVGGWTSLEFELPHSFMTTYFQIIITNDDDDYYYYYMVIIICVYFY